MEKMRLTLDELEVQSFATAANRAGAAGTVHAHADTVAECPTGDANVATCVEYGCVWASGEANSCDGGSCACLSAGCGGSDGCPSGSYCWGTWYGSGKMC